MGPFLAYEIHSRGGGTSDSKAGRATTNFLADWANVAIAIVVVTWLGDMADAQFR